jgi:hypothetical protein
VVVALGRTQRGARQFQLTAGELLVQTAMGKPGQFHLAAAALLQLAQDVDRAAAIAFAIAIGRIAEITDTGARRRTIGTGMGRGQGHAEQHRGDSTLQGHLGPVV